MTKQEVVKIVTDMIAFPGCYEGLKTLGQQWLDADGTEKKTLAPTLIAAAKECIQPIDNVINFMGSPAGEKAMGADVAKHIHDHAVEIKAQGAVYCDCPACTGCKALIDNEQAILNLYV